MKTIAENKSEGEVEVKRVKDGEATKLVSTGLWMYVPKSWWKALRGVEPKRVTIAQE